MSLSFTGATDRVAFGSAADIDNLNAGTYIAWCYLTSLSVFALMWDKAHRYMYLDNGTGRINLEIERATTLETAWATQANFAALGINKWCFFAATWNSTGANGDHRLYVGDAATPAAEPSAYGLQQLGTGAVTSDAATNLTFGNAAAGGSPMTGRGGVVMLYNSALATGAIRSLQYQPQARSGCLLYSRLGFNGTGTQADWSGNVRNGTVTAATLHNSAPPIAWGTNRPGWRGAFTAAAAGMLRRYNWMGGIGRPVQSLVGGLHG